MKLTETPHLGRLLRAQRQKQAPAIWLATASSVVAASAAVLLLGISGWFITGAAIAGVAGIGLAQAFNFLLPSTGIRLMAILRTGFRYLERVSSHEASLKALANIRPALFAALAAAPPRESLSLSGGEASARLIQDVDALETLFIRLPLPWTLVATLITGLGLAGLAGWAPAAALALFAGLSVMAARWSDRWMAQASGAGLQVRTGELKDCVAAFAAAGPELRCYGLEAWATETIDQRGRALGAMRLGLVRAQGWSAALQALILGIGVAVVIALAAPASLPLAAMAGLAASMTLESVAAGMRAFNESGAAAEAARRIEPLLAHASSKPVATEPFPTIQLGDATFAPGDRIALVGPSGAGKTTLMERLVGLRPSPQARSGSAVLTSPDWPWAPAEACSPTRRRMQPCWPERCATIFAWVTARLMMWSFGRHCGTRRLMSASGACPWASTPGSARMARGCREANGGDCRWPALCCGRRHGCCWMK